MLNKENLHSYWEKRYREQGDRTVGFAGRPLEEQDKNYETRHKFIIPKIAFYAGRWLDTKPDEIKVLDYGCGIGRYAEFFPPDQYLGVDISTQAVLSAKKRNPKHRFLKIEELTESPFSKKLLKFDIFSTKTVLQHCSDDVVDNILSMSKHHMKRNCIFSFYENCQPKENLGHVAFRQPMDYMDMLSNHFDIRDAHVEGHTIHGELHAICIYKVIKK